MVAEDFETVLKGKYPGKAHAKRVVEQIRKDKSDATGILYLEGRHMQLQEDNDSPVPFRQRRYFYYLTGSNDADCHYTYEIESGKSTLYIPPIEADEVIWSGLPLSKDEALVKYDVDQVLFTNEINDTLSKLASSNSTVFAIDGQISEHIKLDFKSKDLKALKPAIEIARVVKDEFEVAMIRKANAISSEAHKAVIGRAKTATNEREFEATFRERCIANGGPEMAYSPILAAGRAAATLHYVDNNASLEGKQNLLIDGGAEWNNYASDITRTFPLNGKFTPESRAIYDIVMQMQAECTSAIKAGQSWEDIHLLAHRIAVIGLLSVGILKGDKDEILKARTSAAFFPHGLGHYLGMDTHDVGGNPKRDDPDIIFRYLRLRGTLPAGSVVTVEPGIYFCDFIIRPYLKDPNHMKYINEDVLNKFWDVGGIRIEDNILVTETGYENLTTAVKEANAMEALAARN